MHGLVWPNLPRPALSTLLEAGSVRARVLHTAQCLISPAGVSRRDCSDARVPHQSSRPGETRYLTRREASAACACHVDTIRRAEVASRLSSKRTRADGTLEIPVADLAGAGLLDPLAAGEGLPELVTRTRAQRDLLEVSAGHRARRQD